MKQEQQEKTLNQPAKPTETELPEKDLLKVAAGMKIGTAPKQYDVSAKPMTVEDATISKFTPKR